MHAARLLVVVAALLSARPAVADDKDDDDDDDDLAESPTSTKLERRELDRRPHLRTSDLLRQVPGLYTLAHGGQAPQYLVRGFAAGHGDDLGVLVDGVPINIGSHAYDHGYADTQFLIADTIESIALHEGAYAARFGSYSVAG